MDIATLVGIVFGLGVVFTAIFLGGDFGTFVNVPSLLVVFGGTTAATLIKFPMKDVLKSLKIGVSIGFKNPVNDPQELYDRALELAKITRDKGLLGLENVTVDNELFQRGISMCVDGHNEQVIRETLTRTANTMISDAEAGETMFRGIGDSAPAFGMIGTLVGLVQMLSNLSDPASIGPAMAVAMLTTFYGALLANLIALPLADKLSFKAEFDRNNLDLIMESVLQIQQGQNPSILAEILSGYLPSGSKPKQD